MTDPEGISMRVVRSFDIKVDPAPMRWPPRIDIPRVCDCDLAPGPHLVTERGLMVTGWLWPTHYIR